MILGIDIGANGALALLSPAGELLGVFDMPTLADGPKNRRAVNAALLADIVFKAHATAAYVEYVGAWPGEGAVGGFRLRQEQKGVVEGVLAAAGLPVTFLTPPTWKRIVRIAAGRDGAKDAARAEAVRRWPSRAKLFARVKDDGRAEAALIGLAGLTRTTP